MQDGLRSQSQLAASVMRSGQLLRQHLVAWPVAHHPRNKVICQTLWRCLVTSSLPAAASNYPDVRARRQRRRAPTAPGMPAVSPGRDAVARTGPKLSVGRLISFHPRLGKDAGQVAD
jgi:hypothetical protein